MSNDYIAKPPLLLGRGSAGGVWKQFRRMFGTTFRVLWQVFVPFNPQPEEPDSLPNPTATITKEQVDECQWIFDQAEERRDQLEQKAQWAFALILFLVPVLSSIVVFLLKETVSGTASYWIATILIVLSATFLLMAFVSVLRAISVQARQTLYLGALVNLNDGQFRPYDAGFHARGLLWCASVNTAMNDHLAQFVKGAHLLSAAAVLMLAGAGVPTGVSLLQQPPDLTQAAIVKPVTVNSPDLAALGAELRDLRVQLAHSHSTKDIEQRLARLEKLMVRLQPGKPKAPRHKRH